MLSKTQTKLMQKAKRNGQVIVYHGTNVKTKRQFGNRYHTAVLGLVSVGLLCQVYSEMFIGDVFKTTDTIYKLKV